MERIKTGRVRSVISNGGTLTANVPSNFLILTNGSDELFRCFKIIVEPGMMGVLPATVQMDLGNGEVFNLDQLCLPSNTAVATRFHNNIYHATGARKTYYFPQGIILESQMRILLQHTSGGSVAISFHGHYE